MLSKCNQKIISSHHLLHIVAPRGIVFERIMVEGRPAFFAMNEDPYESFSRLWDERSKVYGNLTECVINNNDTVEHAVNQAIIHLNQQSGYSHYA